MQAFLKQLGHKQSTISEGLKIGGKSLHQHLFPTASPHPKGVSQLEQFLTRMEVVQSVLIILLFQWYEKTHICVLVFLEFQKDWDEIAQPIIQFHQQQWCLAV